MIHVWLLPLAVALPLFWTGAARAATFNVTTTVDSNDGSCDEHCSLREAIVVANASPGPDEVEVPQGTYVLTLTGINENGGATGDLDITDDLVLSGAGADVTIVDGNATDRVIEIVEGTVTVTIRDMTIQNGSSNLEGGGIRSFGSLTLIRVAVNENATGSFGGGLYNGLSGVLTVIDSTISGNTATVWGGGIFSHALAVLNSTISGNLAMSDGGGIYGSIDTLTTLRNVTITLNTSASGEGGGIFGLRKEVGNSIVANNSPRNCAGVQNSLGYNLDDDGSCGFADPSDLSNVPDAGLGVLQNNGGPTATHALLSGSPAIDAGNPGLPGSSEDTCEPTDQRGIVRPAGPACDIGAFELRVPACGDSVLDPGEDCEDGNLIDGDGCSSICEIEICRATPRGDCRTAVKSLILVKQKGGTRDKLTWKWSRGEKTSQAEFADPTASTEYRLCLYAGAMVALVGKVQVPPDGAKWKPISTKGYKYKDRDASQGGIQTMLLKGSDQDKSKILVKGKGAELPDPVLPLEPPVVVQLVNGDTGLCWGSSFDEGDVSKNEVGQFKAKQ